MLPLTHVLLPAVGLRGSRSLFCGALCFPPSPNPHLYGLQQPKNNTPNPPAALSPGGALQQNTSQGVPGCLPALQSPPSCRSSAPSRAVNAAF